MRRILLILSIVAIFGVLFSSTIDIAYRLAKITQRKLIVMFSSPTCYYCILFKDKVLPDPKFQAVLVPNFVFVEIYPSSEKSELFAKEVLSIQSATYRDLFERFRVMGTPTFFFFKDKQVLGYLPGYLDGENFTKVLKYVAQEKKESLESYLKKEDPFEGTQVLVEVTEEEAQFVLAHEKNSQLIEKNVNSLDKRKIYVVKSKELADELLKRGVYRVLLVK